MASSISITGSSSLKTDYYMRSYYGNSKSLRNNSGGRAGEKDRNLALVDAKALRAAIKDLKQNVSKESEDSLVEVSAFLNTYNNLMDATKGVSDREVKSVKRKMNSLMDKYANQLEKMGITRTSSGKLEIDKDTFEKTDIDDLKEVFSKDTNFSKSMTSLSRKMEHAATIYKDRSSHIEQMLNQSNSSSKAKSLASTIDLRL